MPLLIIALVILAAMLLTLGVRRYGEPDRVSRSWSETDERFVDPGTGRTMRVFVDEQGGRHYVPVDRAE